jgi:hypothetical protein
MNVTWEQRRLFFARLFSRGQHGVETMRESLDRQTRIQRLVGQVRALARERNDLVVTMGKKVYALHTRGKIKNRDVLSDCLRLDQIRAEIADLKRKIEEIRLADTGEMPPVDLEDDSFLAEDDPVGEGEDEPAGEAQAEVESAEEAEELTPPQADGPAPEPPAPAESAAEADEAESDENGAQEPAGV